MNKALKITLIVIGCILLLIALLLGGLWLYVNGLLNKVDRTEITGNLTLSEAEIYEGETVDATDSVEHIDQAHDEFQEAQEIAPLKDSKITNILLIGTDRHASWEYGRSDSMMILSVNARTKKIHLTSLMRAMYVCIPRSDGEQWGMLNAAYSWGGPKLLIETIENNFRIDIDHYVVVDFAAFEKGVDLLGGVEITLSDGEARYINGASKIPTYSGTQTLNGLQARIYCQIRLIDNDFVRTKRQRTMLTKLMNKAASSSIPKLIDLAETMLPYVNTDMTNGEILSYIAKVPSLMSNPVTQRMLPIENEAGKSYTGIIFVQGREMYKVDFNTNIRALHEFIMS